MLTGIKGIIFDMDGTLVDSMWIWRHIDMEYLGRLGLTMYPTLQQEIEGMSFSETAGFFKKKFALEDSVDEIKADWNRMALYKYTHEVPLKQGVPEFLAHCRGLGIRMGIATSNSRELTDTILRVHKLCNFMDAVVTSCEVEKGKPAPDVYLAAAAKLEVSPENCLVFEDIVMGIRAGKAAGMKVCAVEDAYSVFQTNEKKALADYYISGFHNWEKYERK